MRVDLAIASCFYVLPKIGAYLSTKPPDDQIERTDYRFRECFSRYHEGNVRIIGEKNWSIFTGVFVDNAWIAALIESYSLRNGRFWLMTIDQRCAIPANFFLTCMIIYSVRYVAAKYLFPGLTKLITPRDIQEDVG